jgi:hypothetical protein
MNLPFLARAPELIPNAVVLSEMVPLRVRQLAAGFSSLINVPLGMSFADVALSEILAKELGDTPGADDSPRKGSAFLDRPMEKLAA